METMKCKECGAEFAPKRHTKKYCSPQCQKKAAKRRNRRRAHTYFCTVREAQRAMAISKPVSTDCLMRATVKPENTSEVRGRMELRRRARAEYYSHVGVLI